MKLIYTFCLAFLMASCRQTLPESSKIDGVSYVASKDSINYKHIKSLLRLHANYVSLMPFGFMNGLSSPSLHYNSHRQWFGETKRGVKQYIKALKGQHIQIMMKPQIWIWKEGFTGEIDMLSDTDWKRFEDAYTTFILDYASVAQETNVEMFCVGTELERFVDKRPVYWKELIKRVRQVYKGKLTYAANWNEFTKTPFWDELDFIGVDAYFPVSDSKTPSVMEVQQGLQHWKELLKTASDSLKKPVLFTEFGYRSVDFTGKAPWQSNQYQGHVNLKGQSNALLAFFNTFWEEPWVAGGFVWKWHHNHKVTGGAQDNHFTPQNKPAEAIIRKVYSQN